MQLHARSLLHSEEGATMPEYAIMVVLIAAVCVLIVSAIGVDVRSLFARVSDF